MKLNHFSQKYLITVKFNNLLLSSKDGYHTDSLQCCCTHCTYSLHNTWCLFYLLDLTLFLQESHKSNTSYNPSGESPMEKNPDFGEDTIGAPQPIHLCPNHWSTCSRTSSKKCRGAEIMSWWTFNGTASNNTLNNCRKIKYLGWKYVWPNQNDPVELVLARKWYVSRHGFLFKISSTQFPLQVLKVCKWNFRTASTNVAIGSKCLLNNFSGTIVDI